MCKFHRLPRPAPGRGHFCAECHSKALLATRYELIKPPGPERADNHREKKSLSKRDFENAEQQALFAQGKTGGAIQRKGLS